MISVTPLGLEEMEGEICYTLTGVSQGHQAGLASAEINLEL